MQVSMGLLPVGSPTALLPPKRAAYPGRIARKPGWDIRADTKGDQKVEPSTCSPTLEMSCGGSSPPSNRGIGRSPRI